jgi:hypothetical protein
MLLTSALTSWQVRVKPISRSRNWRALEAAMGERRPVLATVVGRAPRGLRVQVYGLNGLLPPADEVRRRRRAVGTCWTVDEVFLPQRAQALSLSCD